MLLLNSDKSEYLLVKTCWVYQSSSSCLSTSLLVATEILYTLTVQSILATRGTEQTSYMFTYTLTIFSIFITRHYQSAS